MKIGSLERKLCIETEAALLVRLNNYVKYCILFSFHTIYIENCVHQKFVQGIFLRLSVPIEIESLHWGARSCFVFRVYVVGGKSCSLVNLLENEYFHRHR